MQEKNLVYLDNAATTYPKPQQVAEGMLDFINNIGGNPGRSGHRLSRAADSIIWNTRDLLAELMGIKNSYRIIFTNNATNSLNLVLKGFLKPDSHVLISPYEHNSVLRPLSALEKIGVKFSIIDCHENGEINLKSLEMSAIADLPQLLILNHVSNVNGYMVPLFEICEIASKYNVPVLLDASQSIGAHPLDISQYPCVAFVAFPGHKSLFGPQGTGCLYVSDNFEVLPLIQGGTGSRSDSIQQPDWLPDALESGTINGVGIAGLKKGVEFVLSEGIENIQSHNQKLARKLISGLQSLSNIQLYGNNLIDKAPNVISFSINDLDVAETSYLLDTQYNIMTRSGLHCAPFAHKVLGTFPKGSVRLSISYLNDETDIDITLNAIKDISANVSKYG